MVRVFICCCQGALSHRGQSSCLSAAIIVCARLGVGAFWASGAIRQVVAGIDYIAMGLVLFSLAVLTSLAKRGVLPRDIGGRKAELPETPD
jgi:hypothetical protein